MDPEMTWENLKILLRNFADERDWNQFHSPKNLAMALIVEAGELVEIFQWMTQEQSKNLSDSDKENVADEIGDILIFLTRFADIIGIDPLDAAFKKIKKNQKKYPKEIVKGKSRKYSEY
jgi:NTP pyrophosphatase (non-canonical NTP hydrolase)